MSSKPTPKKETSTKGAARPASSDKEATAMKWLTRILAVGVAAVPAIAILLVVAFLGTYLTANVPAPGELKQNQVATIVNKQGDLIAKIMPPEGNRQEVTYDQLAKSGLPDAVKAAEDRDFDSNSGFSPRGFSRAVVGKLTGNSGAGGGSTITQQYVKNAMVGDAATGFSGYYRKFKELAISTKMSSSWSKEDIMSAYLNTIYFGRGAYGASAAAQAYFGKDIEDLNTSQAALLAGVIRGPSIYDPAVDEAAAESRWNYVLDGMVTIKSLSQSDRDAQKFPRTVKPEPIEDESSKGPEGLIKNQVLAELDKLGIDQKTVQTEGVKITTGIDEQTQNSLENAAKNQLAGQDDDMRTAEVSIDPETGAVRGYFGGWDGMGWDYASTGLQTGSVFKVFALVAALEQDIPLSKQYSSDPYRAKGGLLVTNSDDESCGTCNLATALKMSLNTVYYRLMMDLDHQADDVKDAAQRLGISKTYDGKASLTSEAGNTEGGVVLGQYDSTVLDMASAYATLAAEGIYRQPYFVQKVETATGDVLYDRKPNPGERVVKKAVADNVTAAMEPIPAYSNGASLNDPSYGFRPSAAKTGTAQLGKTGQNRYAWMVGYTPQLSTAVWVGTEKGDKPLTTAYGGNVYGSGLPAQIWKSAMDGALNGEPIESFPEPEAIAGQAGVPYEPPPVTYNDPNQGYDPNGGYGYPQGPQIQIPNIPGLPGGGGGNGGGGGGGRPGGGGNGGGGGGGGGGGTTPGDILEDIIGGN